MADINGGFGDDILNGTAEGDLIQGFSGKDTLSGGLGNDDILAGDGDDTLNGGDGEDYLNGGNGNDLLDGGRDADKMNGADGNDTYVVDHTGDQVTEFANFGVDTVRSYLEFYILPEHVENLFLYGSAHHGTGNDADNTIIGTDRDNVLIGADGDDGIVGGDGDDLLYGGEGRDQISGGSGKDYIVGGGGGLDMLMGGSEADTFVMGDSTRKQYYDNVDLFATVIDFDAYRDEDKLVMAGSAADYSVIQVNISGGGALDTVISQQNGNTIAVLGYTTIFSLNTDVNYF